MPPNEFNIKRPNSSMLREGQGSQCAVERVARVRDLLLTDEKLAIVHPNTRHLENEKRKKEG